MFSFHQICSHLARNITIYELSKIVKYPSLHIRMPPRSFGRDEKTEGHLSIHSLVKAKLTMTLLLAISIHPVYWFVKTGDQPAPYPQDAGLPRKTADRKKQLRGGLVSGIFFKSLELFSI